MSWILKLCRPPPLSLVEVNILPYSISFPGYTFLYRGGQVENPHVGKNLECQTFCRGNTFRTEKFDGIMLGKIENFEFFG